MMRVGSLRDLTGSVLTDSRTRWVNYGWIAVIAALGLSLMGVYAIDLGYGMKDPNAPMLGERAAKQLVFLGAGLVAGLLVALSDFRRLRLMAWVLFAASLVLMVILIVPAMPSSIVRARNGVRAWIDLGFLDLQPTELAKIAFVLVLADWLRFRKEHRELSGLLVPAILVFIPIGLIMLQPDLGSALLFVPTLFAVLVAAGMRIKHLIFVVVLGALAIPASYPLLKPYQQQRIIGLYHQLKGDKSTADDMNYQSVTAISLIGAGGLGGYSDAKARAVIQYAQLPERHNDMIFAIIVARFGLFGAIAMLGMYVLWVGGALLVAWHTKDPFGRLIGVGCAAFVTAQALINTGMVAGVLPIIGVTLPFVSYGGSSMLSVWIMTGLIVSVALRPPPPLARPTFQFSD